MCLAFSQKKKENTITLCICLYMSKTLNINPFHVARVIKQKRADHLSPSKKWDETMSEEYFFGNLFVIYVVHTVYSKKIKPIPQV